MCLLSYIYIISNFLLKIKFPQIHLFFTSPLILFICSLLFKSFTTSATIIITITIPTAIGVKYPMVRWLRSFLSNFPFPAHPFSPFSFDLLVSSSQILAQVSSYCDVYQDLLALLIYYLMYQFQQNNKGKNNVFYSYYTGEDYHTIPSHIYVQQYTAFFLLFFQKNLIFQQNFLTY